MALTNGNHSHQNGDGQHRILVTGGTGLVGRALQAIVESEPVGSRYGKQRADEEWIFLSSKDGDLRCVSTFRALYAFSKLKGSGYSAGTWHKRKLFSTSINLHMSFI